MEEKKVAATSESVSAENNKKQNAKKTNNKNKKPNFFKRIGLKFKDIFSELKKVNWPTFSKVVKQTGIVLAVVVIFLVVITGFDYGISALLGLISK